MNLDINNSTEPVDKVDTPFTPPLLGRAAGWLFYHIDYTRRIITQRNIHLVHPDWTQAQVQRFARRVYGNFGMTLVEMIRTARLAPENFRRYLRVEGEAHIHEAAAQRRGIIIISAHVGNWETALQFYALYFGQSMTAVYKPLKVRWADKWLRSYRSRFGNRLIDRRGAMAEMTRTLRGDGTVGLMVDMARNKQGVPVQFIDRRTTATPAAAMLALRCKSPVMPLFGLRAADGRLILRIEPPVEIQRTGSLRQDLQFNTQRMTDVVVKIIARHPEQWYWMQKRWKSFHPELYGTHDPAHPHRRTKLMRRRSD